MSTTREARLAEYHKQAKRGGSSHRRDALVYGYNEPAVGPDHAAPLAPQYLNYRKTSIYAGSNEIQRNIMAKVVLGM